MRLEVIQGLQIIIVALLSYLPMVALTGWFEAWVSKKCGDDTPEQFGFLTLDPLVHFNIMGFGCLLIGKLLGDYVPFFKGIPGWGRSIPMSPSTQSPWRVALQFNARAIAHFVLSFVAIVGIVQCMKMGYLGFNWVISDNTTPALSSLIYVLQFFYNQNIMLCIIYFAIGTFRTIIHYYFPDFYMFSTENMLLSMFILFGAILVCATAYEFLVARAMALLISMLIL